MTVAYLMSTSGLPAEPRSDTVVVSGDLDLEGSLLLSEAVRQAVRAGRVELTVELGAVRFIDAAGIGVLVAAQRRLAEAGGHLVLTGAGAVVTRVLAMTGTARSFAVA